MEGLRSSLTQARRPWFNGRRVERIDGAATPAMRLVRREPARAVLLAQSVYFVVTGLWALVHMRSFIAITGPKVDLWLVRTVGVLVTVIGAAIGLAALRRRVTPEVELLAAGSSIGLAAIDVVYVARGRISPVYLLDAAGELALMAVFVRSRRPRRRPSIGNWRS